MSTDLEQALGQLDYGRYLAEHPINTLLGIDIEEYGDPSAKVARGVYERVDPGNTDPYPAELDDLIRLHHLATSRKATTVLEFGVGKSSVVFGDALARNERDHGEFVAGNLRRSNAFELHAVDTDEHWIEVCRKGVPEELQPRCNFHLCPVLVSEFNGRLCTYYDNIPNICPDLIYIDGPHQFSSKGAVRGLHTRHKDRLPMAADVLSIEHFLCPGTLIVVDGRTANARFLQCNLQRNWRYFYSSEFDQHFFELAEQPLGMFNKAQIEYCLGEDWLRSL